MQSHTQIQNNAILAGLPQSASRLAFGMATTSPCSRASDAGPVAYFKDWIPSAAHAGHRPTGAGGGRSSDGTLAGMSALATFQALTRRPMVKPITHAHRKIPPRPTPQISKFQSTVCHLQRTGYARRTVASTEGAEMEEKRSRQ